MVKIYLISAIVAALGVLFSSDKDKARYYYKDPLVTLVAVLVPGANTAFALATIYDFGKAIKEKLW